MKHKNLILIFVLMMITIEAWASLLTDQQKLTIAIQRCQQTEAPTLYADDFHFNMTPEEIDLKFSQTYDSGKRLIERMFYDNSNFIFPYRKTKTIKVSNNFVLRIIAQVEKASERNYVKHIFFPDMGHTHLFVPNEYYNGQQIQELSSNHRNYDKLYEALFAYPETKILYHTAEQLRFIDDNKAPIPDSYLLWRMHSRNLLGFLNSNHLEIIYEPTNFANTARKLKGHYNWSAGFNISASKDGCFPYVHDGVVKYFDLSMDDLPYESNW